MATNYNFNTTYEVRDLSQAGISNLDKRYARVVDIVLDETHPDFESFGNVLSLGGIRYAAVGTNVEEVDPRSLPFAWLGSSSVRTYPLIDEIVEIISEPSEIIDQSEIHRKVYYKRIVNIWNSTHHNAFPNVFKGITQARLGDGVVERDDVANLYPFPGDTIIEGRNNQSIRLGGFKSEKNSLTNNLNNGSPFILLRTRSSEPSPSGSVEDINLDSSSIYLLDNHRVELRLSNNKRNSFKIKPEGVSSYNGSQILLNSGRIVLNSKEDSILVSSFSSFGANAKTVNIDATEEIVLDSPITKFGVNASENIVLGKKNKQLLEDILNTLKSLGETLSKLNPSADLAVAQLQTEGTNVLESIRTIKSDLPNILSSKIFSE